MLSSCYRVKLNAHTHTHTLTEPVEVMEASSIPHSLPQAAPISSEGMKTPADTARP